MAGAVPDRPGHERRARPAGTTGATGAAARGGGSTRSPATTGTQIVEAGRAIGRFDSRRWLGEVDVPTAVVVTDDDDVVPGAPPAGARRRAAVGLGLAGAPAVTPCARWRPSGSCRRSLDACAAVARRRRRAVAGLTRSRLTALPYARGGARPARRRSVVRDRARRRRHHARHRAARAPAAALQRLARPRARHRRRRRHVARPAAVAPPRRARARPRACWPSPPTPTATTSAGCTSSTSGRSTPPRPPTWRRPAR